jgi:periplasmic protein TonB
MTLRDVLLQPASAPTSGRGAASVEGFARALIRHAARNAPVALSERLEEEWFADLAARRGSIACLRFALGCCWATRVIAHEFAAPARAAAPEASDKVTALCTPAGPSFYPRRTTVSVLIVALHILVIYGLASGMARTVLEKVPDPLQVTFMPNPKPRYLPPPPPVSTPFKPLRVKAATHELAVDVHLDRVTVAETAVEPHELASSPPPQTPLVTRVIGGPGPGFPNTADFYPDAARRLLEQGSASVYVCVDGSGRLTADPTIAQSSGSARLDQGALRLARAGSGHYRATTEDGKFVSGCYAFRVRFQLRE